MIRQLSLALFILFFLCSSVFAEGNKIDNAIYNKISLSNKFYTNKTEALLLKTGQTTSYYTGDDGDLELGIAHSFTVLTTGQYSGTTNITINGDTHATSNACVQNENTGDMWHREVVQTDLGPASDGRFFWEQYTLAAETCTCNATNKTITADAGAPFSTGALCAGRIFIILGSTLGNNGTFTIVSSTTSVLTVSESVTDEASIALDFASVADTIRDFVDQANIPPGIAGYTDWRIPNQRELESIVDMGQPTPTIDPVVFPSTPAASCWTSTTVPSNATRAWYVYFNSGYMTFGSKSINNFHVRLVR